MNNFTDWWILHSKKGEYGKHKKLQTNAVS